MRGVDELIRPMVSSVSSKLARETSERKGGIQEQNKEELGKT